MSTELEGEDLWEQVSLVILGYICVPEDSSGEWVYVPTMLEWLRGRGVCAVIEDHGNHYRCWTVKAHVPDYFVGPDLPTALARLVLRVAELEGKS